MADMINFTLPNLKNNDSDSKEMKFIKNYLNMFTEQVKFFLNNIDEDNYTDTYSKYMNAMADAEARTSAQSSATKKQLETAKMALQVAIAAATNSVVKFSGGGYVTFLDKDNDGSTDEIDILTASPDPDVVQNKWIWNQNGLAFYDASTDSTTTAITADGQIVANKIITSELEGIGLTFDFGTVAGWNVEGEYSKSTGDFDRQIRQTQFFPEDTYVGGHLIKAGWFDFILKNDSKADLDKKIIYSNKYNIDVPLNPEQYSVKEVLSKKYIYYENDRLLDVDGNFCEITETPQIFKAFIPNTSDIQYLNVTGIDNPIVNRHFVDENGELIRDDLNKEELFSIRRNGSLKLSGAGLTNNGLFVIPDESHYSVTEVIGTGFITSGSKAIRFAIDIPTIQSAAYILQNLKMCVRPSEGGYVKATLGPRNTVFDYVLGNVVSSEEVDETVESIETVFKNYGNQVQFTINFKETLKFVDSTTVVKNNQPISVVANVTIKFD